MSGRGVLKPASRLPCLEVAWSEGALSAPIARHVPPTADAAGGASRSGLGMRSTA